MARDGQRKIDRVIKREAMREEGVKDNNDDNSVFFKIYHLAEESELYAELNYIDKIK